MKEAIRDNFDESVIAYDAYEEQTGRFGTLADRLCTRMTEHARVPITRILDAGAGSGISTRELTARGKSPIALDLSRSMLAANPSEHRVLADFDHLPFATDSLDAVAFTASLFLTPAPEQAAAEARRCLREGGVVGAVAPLGWTTADGSDVFASLDRESRSPTGAKAVGDALTTHFTVETGRWRFETTADDLRAFHSIPAMAARLYPRLDIHERIERSRELLADIGEPVTQDWQWFVGS